METLLTILFSIYLWVLIGGGVVALGLQVRDDFRKRNNNLLEGWNLRWSDALLLAWCIVCASLVLVMVLDQIAQKIDSQYWGISLHLIGWQGGLLIVLVALMKLYPAQFSLKFSPVTLGWRSVLRQSVVQLLAAVLLLGAINMCWRMALSLLQDHGMGNFLREQELVTLLGESLPLGVIITMIIAAVVIAPIAEELLFRGLFYRFLKSRMNARNAMVVSSVCFGALHANALSFLPLVFLGMVLTRAYEHSGNLKVPILMHAIFNANTVFLVLCEPYIQRLSEAAGV